MCCYVAYSRRTCVLNWMICPSRIFKYWSRGFAMVSYAPALKDRLRRIFADATVLVPLQAPPAAPADSFSQPGALFQLKRLDHRDWGFGASRLALFKHAAVNLLRVNSQMLTYTYTTAHSDFAVLHAHAHY